MKNFISILFVTVFVLLLSVSKPAYAISSNVVNLSELTESECIAFLKERGVTIPGDSENELMWGAFAKGIICRVEENPEIMFAFGYTVLLEFANDIKETVNEYYRTARSMHVENPQSVFSLLYSTKHDEWDDVFLNYNCYGYAIETYQFENPGNMRGLSFDMMSDIGDIADIVAADLEWLDYTVLDVSQDRPSVEVSAHTRLICVRKDLDVVAQEVGDVVRFVQDYHFMKLEEDGNWYHKPGNTNTLVYNQAPSNRLAWVYEFCTEKGYFRDDEYKYESDIYYIAYTTPHDWKYSNDGLGQHTLSCTVCNDTTQETCDLEYTCVNNFYHKGTCADCGYSTSNILCEDTYTYAANGSGRHTATCSVCNESVVFSCDLESSYAGSGAHITSCTLCGHYYFASCTAVQTYCGDGASVHVHASACQDCGNPMGSGTTECTFSYVYAGAVNGANTHHQVSNGCGYRKAEHGLCFYKTGNKCLLCGAPKDASATTTLPESDTAA